MVKFRENAQHKTKSFNAKISLLYLPLIPPDPGRSHCGYVNTKSLQLLTKYSHSQLLQTLLEQHFNHEKKFFYQINPFTNFLK